MDLERTPNEASSVRTVDDVLAMLEDRRTPDQNRASARWGLAGSVAAALWGVGMTWWTGEWFWAVLMVSAAAVAAARSVRALRTGDAMHEVDPIEVAKRVLDASWADAATAAPASLELRARIQEVRDRVESRPEGLASVIEAALPWAGGLFAGIWTVLTVVMVGLGAPLWLLPMGLAQAAFFGWVAHATHRRKVLREDAVVLLDDVLDVQGGDDPPSETSNVRIP